MRPLSPWSEITDRHRLFWLIPALLALHNLEEAVTFPRYLPLVAERLPETWRSLAGQIPVGQVWVALAVLTLVPFAVAAWAALRPEQAAAIWLLLLVQATVLVNVIWHVGAAIALFDGYAPGVATAVLLNLPFSIYLIRRAARESWVSPRARWALMPGAVAIHGLVPFGLLSLTGRP